MTTDAETLVENGTEVDETNQTGDSRKVGQDEVHSASACNEAAAENSGKRSLSGQAPAEAAEGRISDQVSGGNPRVEANIDVSKSVIKDSKPSHRQLITQRADQITPRKLRWLWPERIPLGKITIFAGLPGEGKSLATVDIAARVTTGRNYPDVDNPLEASEVLFIAEEDDPEDALVPRLMAAGADRSKVHVLRAVRVNGRASGSLNLEVDVKAIDEFLQHHPKVRLIVFDPISNYLGGISMVDEQKVREILAPLKDIANAHHVAVICVMHLNKKEGLSAIHRVSGAGAFIGVARASWLFGSSANASPERCMLPLKNNYSSEASGLGYRVDAKPVKIDNDDVPTPYIEWLGETDQDVDEIMSAPRKRTSSRARAKLFLQGYLAGGPQDASAAYAAAAADGISERTLDRAKSDLGVDSRKKGTEAWEWELPRVEAKKGSEPHKPDSNVGNLQAVTERE